MKEMSFDQLREYYISESNRHYEKAQKFLKEHKQSRYEDEMELCIWFDNKLTLLEMVGDDIGL